MVFEDNKMFNVCVAKFLLTVLFLFPIYAHGKSPDEIMKGYKESKNEKGRLIAPIYRRLYASFSYE